MSDPMRLLASTTVRAAGGGAAERCAGYVLLGWKLLDVAYQGACNGACNGYLLVVGFNGAGLSPTARTAEVAQTLLRATRGLLRDERKMRKDKIGFDECRRPLSFRSPYNATVTVAAHACQRVIVVLLEPLHRLCRSTFVSTRSTAHSRTLNTRFLYGLRS